jgi:NAD(P)-dependent dehydrogenase (short-subunit alcohol dehydrogenase family)
MVSNVKMPGRSGPFGGGKVLLQGQVAVVTGGGRGIGRAIAKKFASAGAAVVVTARSEKEVARAAKEISEAGGQATFMVGDVSRESDCEKVVNEARKAFAAIHILVNNAGLLGPVQPRAALFYSRGWYCRKCINAAQAAS